MKLFLTAILITPFLLTSCFWDSGRVTETINGITTTTASAIVARSDSLNAVKMNRDKSQTAMYKLSGTDVDIQFDYVRYELESGSFIILAQLKRVKATVKEAPRFQQDLPLHPKDHRVWDTVDLGLKAFLTGFGIYQLSEWGQTVNSNSGTRYNGPINYNSNNPTTTTTAIP